MTSLDVEREIKAIHEELSFIGRYQSSISPKLSKWQELEKRKQFLREELKKFPRKAYNPKKMEKPNRGSMHGVNNVSNIVYQHYYKEPPTQTKLKPAR